MSGEVDQVAKRSKVGIIGGGKVGLQFLHLFSQSHLTQVGYIVDRETSAPAVVEALRKGIAIYTDLTQAVRTTPVDFIVEVTGSSKVVELLHQALNGSSTQLITHDMAFILLQVIDENRQKTTNRVRTDLLEIQKSITSSLDTISGTVDDIKETTSDMHYLSLNARIEAARAGDSGRGFAVVAEQVERTSNSVREMTSEISRVNTGISTIASKIESSLQNLE
jgi:hypothetical protein